MSERSRKSGWLEVESLVMRDCGKKDILRFVGVLRKARLVCLIGSRDSVR